MGTLSTMAIAEADEGFALFLQKAADHPLLTAQEERDLIRAYRAGDRRALERLVSCNLRLVLSIARGFRGRGLEMSDLVQEGVLGLHTAAEKFNPDLGFKFSTYATWWVRKCIQRGVAHAGADTIRLPAGVRQRRGRARAILRKNTYMTIEEVAAEMGEPVELVRDALRAPEVVTTMDGEAWEEDGPGGATLSERLADPGADDPFNMVVDEPTSELTDAVADLPEVQRTVIELRFGLTGQEPMTVGAIAVLIGRPQHFVQSTQAKALKALREILTAV